MVHCWPRPGRHRLHGGLWAGQTSTSIEVTAGNPAAEGQIATVTSVATTPTVVTTGEGKGNGNGNEGEEEVVASVKKF